MRLAAGEEAVDLFAGGGGGWDLAARELGLDPLGVEWDLSACATRKAAGLRTLHADVSELDPLEFAPCRVVIASAPCQAFSMAGSGHGRRAIDAYLEAISAMADGDTPDREGLDDACEDPRAHLILEPLRWALALKPEVLACEQVEPCLVLWEAMAMALRRHGYRTWAGVLSTECFGVPQTRKRAILMCSLVGQPVRPVGSHARYVPPRRSAVQEESLFDAPEAERIVLPEDRGRLPWVSMAEALGWGAGQVGFPRLADTPSNNAGSDVEEINGVRYRARDLRATTEPAHTQRARSVVRFRATNGRPKAAERPLSAPAPALAFGHNHPRWLADDPPTHMNTGRDWKPGGDRGDAQRIPTTEPAPTVSAKLGGQAQWVSDRPATTVCGRGDVFPPGHKVNAEDVAAGRGGQRRSGAGPVDGDMGAVDGAAAVRVSIEEASVLQGFPADHPWQGTKTAKFRQIGDCIPIALAAAVLRGLLGDSEVQESEAAGRLDRRASAGDGRSAGAQTRSG